MKIDKLLCVLSIVVAGLLGLAFVADLFAGIPFGQFSPITDIVVICAAGLIFWQSLETLLGK